MNRAAAQAALATALRSLIVLLACVGVVLVADSLRTAVMCTAATLPVIAVVSLRTYLKVHKRFERLNEAAAAAAADGVTTPGLITTSMRDYDERVIDLAQQLRVAADVSQQHADQAERDYQLATAGVQQLITDLFNAEDATMARLSRDLHDTVKQTLVELAWVEDDADHAQALLARARAELDDVVARTSPIDADLEFVDAVRRLVHNKSAVGLDVAITRWAATEDAHIPKVFATTVYRFYQEALSNAAKHAPNSKVLITFDVSDDGVTATVEDDGPGGLDRSRHLPGQHFGLTYMEQRAAMLEGNLNISSPAGEGTRLRLELPAVTLVETDERTLR